MADVCRIVAAAEGRISPDDFRDRANSLVIAADAGYKRLREIGVVPDIIIGDFDSSTRPTGVDCPIVEHPCEKDDTDTGLAAEYGFERGCREFAIYCATGGMPDHELANYQLLASLARRGCRAKIVGGRFDVYAIDGGGVNRLELDGGRGRVSIFCVGEAAEGVDIVGLKYELSGHTLRCDYALGVSNERVGRAAYVAVKRGTLLVMVENK